MRWFGWFRRKPEAAPEPIEHAFDEPVYSPIRFEALQNFESPELRSFYMKGMLYTVRGPGKLAELYPQWVTEGKVRPVSFGSGGMTGRG